MSTLVSGPAHELFPALQVAFEEASAEGDLVLVVTVSNACPGTADEDGDAGERR